MKQVFLSTLAFAVLVLLSLAGSPVWGIGEPNPGQEVCAYVCPGSSCDTGCKKLGVWTTCAEFYGNPANDWDSDGVSNSSDNCKCTANSNQANCDGDSQGDACDVTDNSWYLLQTSYDTCHVDIDDHVVYETMEFWSKKTYKSACTGATCIKKHLLTSFNCFTDASLSCCDNNWSYTECRLAWDIDFCGTPACSF